MHSRSHPLDPMEPRRPMTGHHQVLVSTASRGPCSRLAALIIQSAHGTRITRDTQPRPSWTLDEDSWNQWWSYSGVSGPSYWGLLNSDWFMCEKGRRQSPIDLDTKKLVYDAHLTPLRADNNLISGVIYNDGHSIVFNGSMAALTRFVLLEEQQRTKQQQARIESKNGPSDGQQTDGNASSAETRSHSISRRDATSKSIDGIFTLDEHPAEFQLIDSSAGFVIEAADRADGDSTSANAESTGGVRQHDGGLAPMFMRELSNNVDLSIGESDRLQLETIGELRGQQQTGQPEVESFDETDQMSGNSVNSLGGSLQTLPASNQVHFTGAGSAYSYRFEALQLKFGSGSSVQSSSTSSSRSSPSKSDGSEHQIDGRTFAAELQLLAYNWQLYRSYDESLTRPYGLLGISILVDTIPSDGNDHLETNDQKSSSGDENNSTNANSDISSNNNNRTIKTSTSNEQLERLLVSATNSLNHRGAYAPIRDLNLSALLPETDQFVTYEGSLTQPGCHESVTWLILNKPLYISKQILDKLRSISADELSAPNPTGTLIAGNTRPTQPINNRPIRTNIRPPSSATANKPIQEVCPRLWTKYEYTRLASRSS